MEIVEMKLHHVEFYVGNIIQSANYYEKIYGFTSVFQSGLATGNRESSSVALKKGDALIVLTSPLNQKSEVAEHLRLHGDSVQNIAMEMVDVEKEFSHALQNGAKAVMIPTLLVDKYSSVTVAKIKTFGSCIHTFLQFNSQGNKHLPGYVPLPASSQPRDTFINNIDHLAICVNENKLSFWEKYYTNIFGCKKVHNEAIDTGKTSMKSLAMEFPNGGVKFVFTEPVPSHQKSQIQEFIDFHGAEGVQHLAFNSDNISHTVSFMQKSGVQFLSIPGSYYELRKQAMPEMAERIEGLKRLGILIDKDNDGYLLQVFTKPIQTRPTGFLEIIQRFGAKGFGSGNINTLFKAIEMEQVNRGTL